MDDIRVKLTFFDHIKTKRIIAKYGVDGAFSILRLWAYAAKFAQKGDLTDFDEVEWKAATGRDTDCIQFVNDLYTPGMNFLDKDKKGRILLHDWREHQGFVYYADERSKIARKNIEKRWKSAKTKKKKDNTDSIPSVSDSYTSRNSPSPLPSPKGRGASRPERISFEKAEAAWQQFSDTVLADKERIVIDDELSRKVFVELGGKDRIMELHSQNRLKTEFVSRYSVLELSKFKAAV